MFHRKGCEVSTAPRHAPMQGPRHQAAHLSHLAVLAHLQRAHAVLGAGVRRRRAGGAVRVVLAGVAVLALRALRMTATGWRVNGLTNRSKWRAWVMWTWT